MNCLRLVSLMAPNAEVFYRAVAGWLARRSGLDFEVESSVPWQERERMLDRGEAHIGFLCGLSYVRKVDGSGPELKLLAAPVMQRHRYGGKQAYFSDVVVRRDSPFRRFEDLCGASWAYNEPGSHSGFNLPLAHLARHGAFDGFFRRVVESAAHQNSLQLVARGQVDAAAIDSIVLEREIALQSDSVAAVRVLETLGPSPAPPAVVHGAVPATVRDRLRELLTTMHEHAEGRAILRAACVSHFMPVSDRDYDPNREIEDIAAKVRWCVETPTRKNGHERSKHWTCSSESNDRSGSLRPAAC